MNSNLPAQNAATTPVTEPLLAVYPNFIRVNGVRLTDAEMEVLRGISDRMRTCAKSQTGEATTC